MKDVVLIDTGPLVTFLAAGLEYHGWVCEQWQRLSPARPYAGSCSEKAATWLWLGCGIHWTISGECG